MTIHPEGKFYVTAASTFFFGVIGAIFYFELPVFVAWPLGLVSGSLWLIILQFFRMPTKHIVIDNNAIVAPADGKVVVIERVNDLEFVNQGGQGPWIQVSIFMSPFNVHSNHNPVSGIVSYFKYHPGKFLVAWHPKSSTENERTTLIYQLPTGKKLMVRQIAGALARRICWYVKTGVTVEQAQQFGFIKFGSRVDLFLPTSVNIKVELGQKTIGAETVIATWSGLN